MELIKDKEEFLSSNMNWSVKILEKAGKPLIETLSRSTPIILGCPEKDSCVVCKEGEGTKCSRKNIVYRATCGSCRPSLGDENDRISTVTHDNNTPIVSGHQQGNRDEGAYFPVIEKEDPMGAFSDENDIRCSVSVNDLGAQLSATTSAQEKCTVMKECDGDELVKYSGDTVYDNKHVINVSSTRMVTLIPTPEDDIVFGMCGIEENITNPLKINPDKNVPSAQLVQLTPALEEDTTREMCNVASCDGNHIKFNVDENGSNAQLV